MDVIIAPSDTQAKIMELIRKKGANLPCPRCGKGDFMEVNGYFSMSPGANPEMTQLSGYSIPLIATKCKNCGFLSFHDLNVLEHI